MGNRALKSLCLVQVGGLMVFLLTTPVQAADVRKITPGTRLTGSAADNAAASIRSVKPTNPVLVAAGNPVSVSFSGSGLEHVTGVQVVQDGRVFSNVQAQLVRQSSTDLVVSLTAGRSTPAGTYTLRLVAGQQMVDIPASVADVLVKNPPHSSPGAAALEVERAPSTAGAQETMTRPQMTSRQSQMLANVVKAQNDASNSVIRKMDGGSPTREAGDVGGPDATGDSTGTGEVSGQTQGIVSSRRIRPPGDAMVARRSYIEIPLREAPENLGPRILEGPRDATSPEGFAYRFDKNTAGTITSAVFDRAVKEVLAGARFHSNSCGGTWEVRRITIDIPNTYFSDSTSLNRLDYRLTDNEVEESEWLAAKGTLDPDLHQRIKWIRACVDDWLGNTWTGRVENGVFKIYLVHEKDRIIKTRSIEQHDFNLIWQDIWDWHRPNADLAIPDYWLGNSPLEITLSPAFNDGALTYSQVDAKWVSTEGNWTDVHRAQYQPYLGMINDYRGEKLEQIRRVAISLFNDPSVRNRISQALTAQVLSNQFVNRIVELTGGTGDEMAYRYE